MPPPCAAPAVSLAGSIHSGERWKSRQEARRRRSGIRYGRRGRWNPHTALAASYGVAPGCTAFENKQPKIYAGKLPAAAVIPLSASDGFDMSGADQYKRRVFSEELAHDQELPPSREKKPPDAKVIPLYRDALPPVTVGPDRIISQFPFDTPDTASQVVFEHLDQDLRALKDRYLAALEKKAETADRPELAQDVRIIAKRVAASFTSLILLSDLLAGLPHDNDDLPA